ncbi:hypothetical protein EH220_02880 [bacterium]|nr:MAG: hypothetical protein EH220_02880 [bacterium]
MRDRHVLLILIGIAFFGAMFLVTDLASNSALAESRGARAIPEDLSTDLGLTDSAETISPDEVTPQTLSLTIEQSELERLDTLLKEMSEVHTLLDENTESRILISSSYMQ